MSAVYRRFVDVDAEDLADDLILMHARTRAVVVLNASGRLVWDALAEGAGIEDLVALFVAGFPDAAPEAVRRDVEATLRRLIDAGLAVT